MKRLLPTLLPTLLTAATFASPALAERIPLEPGPDTTVFEGPLRNDGTVDYIAALNRAMSEGVKTQDNAFVELWLTHPERENTEGDDPTAKMLGLGVVPEGPVFTPWGVYLEEQKLGDDPEQNDLMFDLAIEGPFTSRELPVMAAWLERNGPALDRVMAAVDRPAFYAPWTTGSDSETADMVVAVLLPHLSQYRAYGRSLLMRVHLALGEGRHGEAVAPLLAIRRLAAHVANEPTLISNLVGLSLDALAAEALASALSHGGFTEAQLERLADGWSPELGRLGMADTVDRGERLFMLDMLQQAWAGRLGEDDGIVDWFAGDESALVFVGVLELVRHERFDINAALRASNAAYDELVAVFHAETYAQFMEQGEAFEAELEEGLTGLQSRKLIRAARGEGMDELSAEEMTELVIRGMHQLLMPAVSAARRSEYAAQTRDDLAKIAIAIERHRLAHGTLPGSLEDLEKLDPTLYTTDRFNEQPLVYTIDEDASGYTLYSVGQNLTDDGGLDDRHGGDVVFRVARE